MTTDFILNIQPRFVKNFWTGRDNYMPVAIVEHIMQGTLEETWQLFNGASGESFVSTHYGIGKDGQVWQFVRDEDTAWANGVLNTPNNSIEWLAEVNEKAVNPNLVTLSISYEGFSGEPLSEEQYQAALTLHRQLVERWEIPMNSQHILGHNHFDSVERQLNPGPAFPWDRLFQDLNDKISEAGEGVQEEEEELSFNNFGSTKFSPRLPTSFSEKETAPLTTPPSNRKPYDEFASFSFENFPSDTGGENAPSFSSTSSTGPNSGSSPDLSGQGSPSNRKEEMRYYPVGEGEIKDDLVNIRQSTNFDRSNILRTASKGTRFSFNGYKEGAELEGSSRWLHLEEGGWVHSVLVKLDHDLDP